MSYLSDLLGSAYKEGMTEDEISTALEAVGHGNDAEVNRLKTALSKANSEAEEHDKLVKENGELKRSIALSESKGKLLAMGYDEKLADETAAAMVDGDMEKVMANQSKYLEAQKKAIQADAMRKTPRPAAGSNDGSGVDYAKKISEAQANGDFTAAAYYTRLQAQEMATEQAKE